MKERGKTPDLPPWTQRDDRKREEGTRFDPPPEFDPANGQHWMVQNGSDSMIRIYYTKDAGGGLLLMPGSTTFFQALSKVFGIYVFWDGGKPQPEKIYTRVVTEKEAEAIVRAQN